MKLSPIRTDASSSSRQAVAHVNHIRDDTLTAGRLVEECLGEAQGQNLSEDEVIDAAGGNLFTFVVAELNRAADQKIDEEGE
jgi:hypothetical protein